MGSLQCPVCLEPVECMAWRDETIYWCVNVNCPRWLCAIDSKTLAFARRTREAAMAEAVKRDREIWQMMARKWRERGSPFPCLYCGRGVHAMECPVAWFLRGEDRAVRALLEEGK